MKAWWRKRAQVKSTQSPVGSWPAPRADVAATALPQAPVIAAGADRQDTPNHASAFTRFAHLTDRIVVIDTETTGVCNSDRVLEVAVVTLALDGTVIDEWDTLVQAGRDVGPTWIHGITASMLSTAPTFDEIAADLAARLHGALLCAHNLAFDSRMLRNEFDRVGVAFDATSGLDTLLVTGSKLAVACQDYGIGLSGAHRALNDARATAELVCRLADRFDEAQPARFLGTLPDAGAGRRHCRSDNEVLVVAPPTYLAALASKVVHGEQESSIVTYLELLDRAMADLHLDIDELAELEQLASEVGLSGVDVDRAHLRWVDDLIDAARADGVVDGGEYDELLRAAFVLGVDAERIHRRTLGERSAESSVTLSPGLGVCFTGQAVDRDGQAIDRDRLEWCATQLGLRPEATFTKSRCALLVAADAASMSGKAGRARDWGIPIVSVSDFIAAFEHRAADALVTIPALRTDPGVRKAVRCAVCSTVFTFVSRSGLKPVCSACGQVTATRVREATKSSPTAGDNHGNEELSGATGVASSQIAEVLETLVCRSCAGEFDRARTRGRKPHHCPACR